MLAAGREPGCATDVQADPAVAIRAPALVCGGSRAVCEALIHSLCLQRATVIPLAGLLGTEDGSAGGGVPQLAVVIDSSVAAVERAIVAVRRRWPGVRVLVIGVQDHEDAILRCFRAGADGLVGPDEPLAEAAAAMRMVLADAVRPPPNTVRPFFQRLIQFRVKGARSGRRVAVARLSARETEVLRYVVRGQTNKEIAVALHVEVQTVKNHVSDILRKLGVSNRYDAARRQCDA
jgi:DNA-binding NarL/FixJ family response regulator